VTLGTSIRTPHKSSSSAPQHKSQQHRPALPLQLSSFSPSLISSSFSISKLRIVSIASMDISSYSSVASVFSLFLLPWYEFSQNKYLFTDYILPLDQFSILLPQRLLLLHGTFILCTTRSLGVYNCLSL
jgi:hypothetical protein